MAQILGLGVTITATGLSAATGAASAQLTIPNDSSGRVPNYVRIASRNECYVKMGAAGVVATTSDILVQPADSIILQVPKGCTTIAHIQGSAAGFVNVTPLENS
jgi:hypothetical protein